ncbi:MAG: dephospho-CoA kinase [Clostridiaceae bacterium]|jgi:dephospho-CoA kinase|nr:dephospho-CoA kinase [Clostridiaceae bacterium]
MFVLGITGGIGSGKSTVAAICRTVGLPVIDADLISHELTGESSETTRLLEEVFGSKIIREDGALDRQRMSDLVFHDKRYLDKLSAIIHEQVIKTMEERLREAEKKKTKAIVLDVPIPVKRGFVDLCDQIWTVFADSEIRKNRLLKRGMSIHDIERRMRVQMSPEEYRKIAHHEICNNGTFQELEEQVHTLLKQELGIRGIPIPGLPQSSLPGDM